MRHRRHGASGFVCGVGGRELSVTLWQRAAGFGLDVYLAGVRHRGVAHFVAFDTAVAACWLVVDFDGVRLVE